MDHINAIMQNDIGYTEIKTPERLQQFVEDFMKRGQIVKIRDFQVKIEIHYSGSVNEYVQQIITENRFIKKITGNINRINFPDNSIITELIHTDHSDITPIKNPTLYKLTSLMTLDIYECYQLKALPNLSNLTSLKTLYITYCNNITEIKNLPDSLTKLGIGDCEELQELHLPASLKMLSVQTCYRITLPFLPDSLRTLILCNCTIPQELPQLWYHTHITTLVIDSCGTIQELHLLPAGLKKLDISNCYHLTEIGSLPAGLTTLTVKRCMQLTKLPYLSKLTSLTTLNIAKCPLLENSTHNEHLGAKLNRCSTCGLKLNP